MKWQKAPQEVIDFFERIAPRGPGIVGRTMFGYPCRFLNGNMFIGVFQEKVIIRLSEKDRKTFFQQYQASPFEPIPGRPMKEYVVLPQKVLETKVFLKRGYPNPSRTLLSYQLNIQTNINKTQLLRK